MHESSVLRLDPNEKLKLDEQDSIIPNSTLITPKTIIELPNKSYVDSLHENRRNRRGLSTVFIYQDNEVDNNNLTNLDSITVNRNPSSDNEVSNEKNSYEPIGEGTLLRFFKTLENYIEVSIGNDTYNLIKYNKIQYTDTAEFKFTNKGSVLSQKWNFICNNKNNESKVGSFIKSTKINSPTG